MVELQYVLIFGIVNFIFGITLAVIVLNQYDDVYETRDGQKYNISEVLLALRLACARLMKGADQHAINMLAIQLLREAKAARKTQEETKCEYF